MNIYVKGTYTILGKINSNVVENTIDFTVPLERGPEVIVNIILDENKVESFHETEITKEMWFMLQEFQNEKIFDAEKTPNKLKDELSEIRSNITKATKKVLYLIKYGLNCTDLDDDLVAVKEFYWSVDKSEWKIMPPLLSTILDMRAIVILNKENSEIIQKYILDDYKPFLALNHLHRAIKEKNPRYKWIDATIAAELAIKEFLVSYVPDIEPFLMEVPSPPLYKLYGSILEKYAGEKSPKFKEIKNGAEVRNILIHRPKDTPIGIREANRYVHNIEIAIYHLLSLLYPKDIFIEMLYKQTKRVSF